LRGHDRRDRRAPQNGERRYSTPTPWHTPREISEQELAQVIADLLDGTDDFTRSIFNFHVPPIDSTLDTCPELDWTTDPPSQIVRGGQVLLYGAGSKAVREAIEKHQPMLSLHGHIHESGVPCASTHAQRQSG
jgi:Icc-related predicted phosphoesterase